jgi:hypothetical protein
MFTVIDPPPEVARDPVDADLGPPTGGANWIECPHPGLADAVASPGLSGYEYANM